MKRKRNYSRFYAIAKAKSIDLDLTKTNPLKSIVKLIKNIV